MMIREVPTILVGELYAIPALVGAAVAVAMVQDEVLGVPGAVIGALVCFGIRIAAIRYRLNAPTARTRLDGLS